MYILILVFSEINTVTTAAGTFGNSEIEGLGLNGLIRICSSVIVREADGRDCVFTGVTRDSKKIINHISFYSISCQLGLVGDLCVIFIKVFGKGYHWLFDKLEVTHSADNHSYCDWIVGFHL